MKKTSFIKDVNYGDNNVVAEVIMETSFSREIRILLKEGQTMKEHKTPFPIIIHLIKGKINFGVHQKMVSLKKGDILSLEPNSSHDLTAVEDSIIRLSLSKGDSASRVKKVVFNT